MAANAAPVTFEFAEEFAENQGKLTVVTTEDGINNNIAITVEDGVANLEKWTSTDPTQALFGDQPWIAVDINTGVNDITKLTYNGSALTQTDVDEAAAWGLGAGHIILWLRANAVQVTPKQITLSGDKDITFTVTVADAI